ncbi:MAG: hypothetical protein ACRDO0_13250 [Nocardioidaceae bacterium]
MRRLPLTLAEDVTPGDWIAGSFTMPFGSWVGSFLPGRYAAYARILHRADWDTINSGRSGVRWSQVADEMGTVLDRLSAFWEVAGRVSGLEAHTGGWDGDNPREGSMDPEIYAALPALLRSHTQTPELCWVAIWTGWAWHPPEVDPDRYPQVKLPGREYYLYRGSLDDLAMHRYDAWHYDEAAGTPEWPSFQSPNMIWPQDRAWFVATEVDFDSTLVGGPGDLVRAILEHADLEAFDVREGGLIGSAG